MLLYLMALGAHDQPLLNRRFRQVQQTLTVDQGSPWELHIPGQLHCVVSAGPPCLYETPDRVLFYDGCPFLLDSSDPVTAEHLYHQGHELEERLDGECVLLDIDRSSGHVCVTTDVFGQRPAFIYQNGETTYLSNSVRLLTLIRGTHELSIEAVATLLNADYISRPHTLETGIFWLEPASVYSAKLGERAFQQREYFSLNRLLDERNQIRKQRAARDTETFVSESRNMFAALATADRPTYVAMSGGSDSRLVGVMGQNVADKLVFWTNGQRGEPDIDVAQIVADQWGVDLVRSKFADITPDMDWRSHATEFLHRSDGVSNLSQMFANIGRIANGVMRAPVYQGHETPLVMTGNGAGLVKPGTVPATYWLRFIQGKSAIERIMSNQTQRHGAPLQTAREICDRQIRSRLMGALDSGFSPEDLPYLQFLQERVRGWQANNRVALVKGADYMAPFHTRELLRRSFALSFLDRCRAILHYEVFRSEYPESLRIEFAGKRPGGSRMSKVLSPLLERHVGSRFRKPPGKAVGQAQTQWIEWLSLALPELGAQILESSPDQIWNLIDRKYVQDMLLEAEVRLTRTPAIFLFNLANVVLYDQFTRDALASGDARPLAAPPHDLDTESTKGRRKR